MENKRSDNTVKLFFALQMLGNSSVTIVTFNADQFRIADAVLPKSYLKHMKLFQ